MVCGGLCSETLCVAPEVTLMETERTESQAQGPSQGTHAGRQSPGEEGA